MRKDKPSKTAREVALNIITLGAKPGMDQVLPSGIVEATAKLLVASGVVSATEARLSSSPRMVSIYEAFDWMLPGQFEAFAHRKAFCEQQVLDGITAGANQVLVLGAGYDTMGWRLAPECTNVSFFEIDHPATVCLKAKGVERMGSRANLHLIAEDLGQRKLADVLRGNQAWDPCAQSVVVAEGLLQYLPANAVRNLFSQCASIVGDESRIAFTYIGTDAYGLPDAGLWTGLVMWNLEAIGEPWLWSIRPAELAEFLQETGWTIPSDLAGESPRHGVEFFGVAIR